MSMYNVGPFDRGMTITPSDVTILDQGVNVYVGGAGNVTIRDIGGNLVLFISPAIGSVLPVRARQVMATGTTSGILVGCW